MPLWLSGATAVVFRNDPGGEQVLLVQRADNHEWGPVAGIIDPGEQPHVTAVREVAEETCVKATVERLVWLTVTDMVTYENGDQTQYIDHVFRCAWVSGEPVPGDGEAAQTQFFPVTALPPMSARNRARVHVAAGNNPHTVLGDVNVDGLQEG